MPGAKTTLDQWAVLAAVVDHGGYAQAAAALHKSQPAVSYALARLQEALDVALLVVEGRKAVLTPTGRSLLQRARPLLQDLRTLELLASRLKEGWEAELRLVVDLAYPRERLLAIVAGLQAQCPATRLQLSDAVLSGADEAIEDGSADLVVASRVPAGFLGDHLCSVRFVAVASPAHALCAAGRSLEPADLARHTHVVLRDSGRRNPRDAGWLNDERRCTVSSLDSSLATVKAGLGYAWLPAHLVAGALAEGTLQRLPLAVGATRHLDLYLVVVRPELAGPATRAAVEAFRAPLANVD